jgi:molybdate transport system substrate-binding protein
MRMGVLGLAALAGACGRTPPAETTLTVSVAASVREVVAAVGEDFRRRHPEVRFALNPGSSGLLAQQIKLGAPVDVFVSAGRGEVQRLVDRGLVAGEPRTLARNRLVLVVPRGSQYDGMAPRAALAAADMKRLATGDPETVPVGRYAKEALGHAGLWDDLRPKMVFAIDVRQALTYARERSVDAAVVYATDVLPDDNVVTLGDVPGAEAVHAEIVAARLVRGESPAAAQFLDELAGVGGTAEFARRGFLPPA